MKKDGGKLRLDYTITNHTKDAYLVRDVMVTPSDSKLVLAPDAIITVRGAPGEVRFVRGDESPDSKVNIRYPPALRALAAGKTLTGHAEVALPLASWHPYGQVQPLDGTPKQATLEVEVYPATIATLSTKASDGSTLTLAARGVAAPITLKAGPKPLP